MWKETITAPKMVQKLACKTALHCEVNFFSLLAPHARVADPNQQ